MMKENGFLKAVRGELSEVTGSDVFVRWDVVWKLGQAEQDFEYLI